MKNVGKILEEQLKKSVPSYSLLYRLPDAAQSFGGSNNLRFSSKNPFDFLLWDSIAHTLYALEIKTISTDSISFERDENEKGIIHYHQIKGLNNWNEYDGIICGFIIEFRKLETTIFLNIEDFNKLSFILDKKSFSIKDLDENNIPYFIISQKKARTRFTYDLDNFMLEMRKTKNKKKAGG